MINEIVFMIVVIFSGLNADGTKNMYVFAKPFYEEEVHCQADITDPAVYPGLIANLVKDYKGIRSDVSKLKLRGCFNIDPSAFEFFVTSINASPLSAPFWFECFDYKKIHN